MKIILFSILFTSMLQTSYLQTAGKEKQNQPQLTLIDLSQQILLAIKTKEPANSFLQTLAEIDPERFQQELSGDDNKKAFWINLYNAYTQVILNANPASMKIAESSLEISKSI
ncbi:MAG: hypothetical protein ABIQ56_05985 [Chitinophagaceae bacterium]